LAGVFFAGTAFVVAVFVAGAFLVTVFFAGADFVAVFFVAVFFVAVFFAGTDVVAGAFLVPVFFAGADFFATGFVAVFFAGADFLADFSATGAAFFVDDFVAATVLLAVARRVTRFAAARVEPASLRAVVRAMSRDSLETRGYIKERVAGRRRLPHACGEDMPHPHP
jgi:hypothetical protein